jgi:colanic acid biosynthesis glycosyl transferase WcaI
VRILMLATAYEGQRGPMEVAADRLRREGHEVDVVRIAVRRSRPGGRAAERVPGFVGNALSALRAAATRRRYDRVLVDTSPPLAFTPFLLRTRLLGEELVLLHYDIFPENLTALGISFPRPALRALGAATHWLARRARAHETLSPAMAATLAEALGPTAKIDVAPLSPPPEVAPVPRARNTWLQEHGLADRFVVMYAGNLGRAYDFAPLLDAARRLEDQEDIVFVFVGAGFQESSIREAATRSGNVILLPPQPEARLAEVLSAGDVHVVPLKPGADRVMWPHKVDAIRAAGRPVLAVGWGEGVDGVEAAAADELAEEIARRATPAK